MIAQHFTIRADRFSDRKAGHPNQPSAQTILGTIIGDSVMKSYECITINGKQKRLHRHIMEQHIGKQLSPNELVHHKDGNKHNNILANLQIITRGDHMKAHRIGESSRFPIIYDIKKDDLVELYINQRFPMWLVAKIIGATYGAVFRALRRHGVERSVVYCHCGSRATYILKKLCGKCNSKDYYANSKRV